MPWIEELTPASLQSLCNKLLGLWVPLEPSFPMRTLRPVGPEWPVQVCPEWGLEPGRSDPQSYAHLVMVSPSFSRNKQHDNKTLSWFGNCDTTISQAAGAPQGLLTAPVS